VKKTILTLLSFLFFSIPKAQVTTLLSFGVNISHKDAEGHFAELRGAIIQEMHITVNLNSK
jgi:hypothetical protein